MLLIPSHREQRAYFSGLNYSLANEDTRVEQRLVRPGTRVLAIAGSGSRVIPLLAANPERLTVVDLSREQLFLAELRVTAARRLEAFDYRFLMGYAVRPLSSESAARERRALFARLALGPEAREFWFSRLDAWAPHGVIWLGRWERHFRKLGLILRKGFALDARPLFETTTLEDQRQAYSRCWSPKRFRFFLKIFASPFVFNRLYKGRFTGSSDTWAFLDRRLTELLVDSQARTNYFASLLFLGELQSEEAVPVEATDETLRLCREAKTEVVYRQGDICDLAPRERASFYSLSDALSYVSDDAGRSVLARISEASEQDSVAVVRYFMRRPKELDTGSFVLDREASSAAERLDSTRMYSIQVYRKPLIHHNN